MSVAVIQSAHDESHRIDTMRVLRGQRTTASDSDPTAAGQPQGEGETMAIALCPLIGRSCAPLLDVTRAPTSYR